MFRAEFFGAEPILLDKIISYTERSGVGKYVYQAGELANVIDDYKKANNHAALEQSLREIFSICNQGRRPWSLEAEQFFLALASAGFDLLNYLRSVWNIPNETYAFIDPLKTTLQLEREAEQLQSDDKRWGETLTIFYRLTEIYTFIYDQWTSDYPKMAKLPTIDNIKYLLETGNDSNFSILLSAFAKTQKTTAKQVLIDYSDDDEQPVRTLTEHLLAKYF